MTPWSTWVRSRSKVTPRLASQSRPPNQSPVRRGRDHRSPVKVGGASVCATATAGADSSSRTPTTLIQVLPLTIGPLPAGRAFAASAKSLAPVERSHPKISRARSDRHRDLLAVALGGEIACIKSSHGVPRDLSVCLRAPPRGAALQEILYLRVEALLPLLVGGRMAPALLGAELLHQVDVAELDGLRVVGVEQVHGVEPAGGAVIVREHLEPVVHPAQHELAREDVGYCPVVEGDVELTVVFHVVVVGAEEAAIAIARQARDVVHAARHRGGTDGSATASPALHRLQIEAGGEGMAALAHQRAAARVTPNAIHGRMRATVRLAPEHPEDLRVGLLDDLALLLHGRGVDPVL